MLPDDDGPWGVTGTTEMLTLSRLWSKLAWNDPRVIQRTMKTACSPAKVLTAATTLMLAASLVGCDATAHVFEAVGSAPGIPGRETVDPEAAGDAARALVQLETIPVKGRALPRLAIPVMSSGQLGRTLTTTVAIPAMTFLPGT
jgi:hypothetical protein